MDISILVFSTDQTDLDTLRRGLITSGFKRIKLTSDPASAASHIEDGEPFDIAIIGITAHRMEGIDLLEAIKRTRPEIECIIVTAANDAELATECMKKGACDYLAVPIVREKLADAIRHAMRYRMPSRGRPRILIMEDEPTSGRLMKHYLNPHGDCTLVTDGKEAVEAFERAMAEERCYHLILLDIMVPEIHGKDVLKRIRDLEKEKGVPEQRRARVIMTTALSDSGNVIDSFKYKCDGYLIKPINQKTLLNEVMGFGLIPKIP